MATYVNNLAGRIKGYIDDKVQRAFTSECARRMDKYIPFSQGTLRGSVDVQKDYVEYRVPYARYQYYGKLMVDPITHKGAFFNPEFGFWSRPKTPKLLTDISLHQNGFPYWDKEMWQHEGEIICKEIERAMKNGEL